MIFGLPGNNLSERLQRLCDWTASLCDMRLVMRYGCLPYCLTRQATRHFHITTRAPPKLTHPQGRSGPAPSFPIHLAHIQNKMSSPVSAIPNLCVDDVLAFSDTELVQYMTQNRRQDGGFDLEFDGWEKLPIEQREQLAERLRWIIPLIRILSIADINTGLERRK